MNYRMDGRWGVRNPFYKKPPEQDDVEEFSSKFEDLALGARFNHPGSYVIWVKIGTDLVAKWDEKFKDCGWLGQSVCCFSEDGDLSGRVYVL